MSAADTNYAILVELRSILDKGWVAAIDNDILIVAGPDTADFVSEVWRIAQFVAYDEYVSIERQPGSAKEYRLTSRSRGGLGLEMIVRANG